MRTQRSFHAAKIGHYHYLNVEYLILGGDFFNLFHNLRVRHLYAPSDSWCNGALRQEALAAFSSMKWGKFAMLNIKEAVHRNVQLLSCVIYLFR